MDILHPDTVKYNVTVLTSRMMAFIFVLQSALPKIHMQMLTLQEHVWQLVILPDQPNGPMILQDSVSVIVTRQFQHTYQITQLGNVFIIVQILMLPIIQLSFLNVYQFVHLTTLLTLLQALESVFRNVQLILLSLEMTMEDWIYV